MKTKQRLLLTLLFLACSLTAFADAKPELEERGAIKAAVSKAFQNREFALLEKMADEYRTNKSKTSSGLWKLPYFYFGLGAATYEMGLKDPKRFEVALKINEEWAKQYPDSPTPWVARAEIYKSYAWAYRGDGYAQSVPKSAWPLFYKLLGKSRDTLEEHKNIAYKDPHWYSLMLDIGKAESWEKKDYLHLLKEALLEAPLYEYIYFEAGDYFNPKWGGSAEEVEQFALLAMKNTQKTEGKSMYARVYWSAAQAQFTDGLFILSKVQWPLMREGFEDIVKKYPDDWNYNNYAKFACLAGDIPKLSELVKKVEGKYIGQAWSSQALYKNCMALKPPMAQPSEHSASVRQGPFVVVRMGEKVAS